MKLSTPMTIQSRLYGGKDFVITDITAIDHQIYRVLNSAGDSLFVRHDHPDYYAIHTTYMRELGLTRPKREAEQKRLEQYVNEAIF